MRVALAACRLMEEVARAHGGIDSEEAVLLRAHRRAMDLGREEIAEAERESVDELALEGDEAEREATIVAMARVAHADGRLPLAERDTTPRPLDPVVVLGFPKGLELLEGEHAVSSPSAGEVRHVEDTTLISADIFPGNSGGPCIDAQGAVIGVAARRVGNESLGRCIQAQHVRALLEGG